MKYFFSFDLIKICILLIISWILPAISYAEKLPEEGIIELIHDDGTIVVSDSAYFLNSQVIVNQDNSVKIGSRHLQEGLSISYRIENQGLELPVISEVWILNRAPVDHSLLDD